MGNWAITWKERKIKNPIGEFLITVFGIAFVAIYGTAAVVARVLLMLLWGTIFVALSPLWIPTHFILRAYGRKGFFTIEGNTYKLAFDREAFSKVEEL